MGIKGCCGVIGILSERVCGKVGDGHSHCCLTKTQAHRGQRHALFIQYFLDSTSPGKPGHEDKVFSMNLERVQKSAAIRQCDRSACVPCGLCFEKRLLKNSAGT